MGAQWEPGSRGRVLRNLRGITRKREMDRVEAQFQAIRTLVGTYSDDHRFTAGDIRQMVSFRQARGAVSDDPERVVDQCRIPADSTPFYFGQASDRWHKMDAGRTQHAGREFFS